MSTQGFAGAESEFKVRVVSGGEVQRDLEQELVHRVELSKEDIRTALRSWPTSLQIPFSGKVQRDAQGELIGVNLSATTQTSMLPRLGLEDNDLLTAVGKKRAESIKDLYFLFEALADKNFASVTVQRNGKPHKILYFLQK